MDKARAKRPRTTPSFLQEDVWKVVDQRSQGAEAAPKSKLLPKAPQEAHHFPEPREREKGGSGYAALKDTDKKSEKEVRDMLKLISDMLPTLEEIQEEKRTRAEEKEEEDIGLDFCQAGGEEGEEEEEREEDVPLSQELEWNTSEILTLD